MKSKPPAADQRVEAAAAKSRTLGSIAAHLAGV